MLRFLIRLFTMPIHEYDGAFPVGTCKFCGHHTGLSGWQLVDIPKEMAYCSKGEKRVFRFSNSFNCRAKIEEKQCPQK